MARDFSRTPSILAQSNRAFRACGNAARPRRPLRWRAGLGAIVAAILASAVMLATTVLPAKAQFTRLFGFGDSYADTGAAPGGAFQLAGITCIYHPNCPLTCSTTFVQSLQSIYGLPGLTNF